MIIIRSGMDIERAMKYSLPRFYALANRLDRQINRETHMHAAATKAAMDLAFNGSEDAFNTLLTQFPSDTKLHMEPTKPGQPVQAPDRNPDGTQKANIAGFKQLKMKLKAGKK